MSRIAELTGATIQVAAGILVDAIGRVLIADRSRAADMQAFWEFPGGKLAPGESADDALCRELVEELGIRVNAYEHLLSLEHDYPQYRVALDFHLVTSWTGEPKGMEGQALRWIEPSAMPDGLLLPADAPVLDALIKR